MAEVGRILIADDEETFSLSTADLLRKQGYYCECVPDGHTALKKLQKNQYDLLVADIKMPGNPNLELIKESVTKQVKVPVILVTGYPSLETAIHSIQLPVFAYLMKPFEFDEFFQHVEKAVQLTQTYRAIIVSQERNEACILKFKEQLENVDKLEKSSFFVTLDLFVQFTTENIANSLNDLKQLTLKLAKQENDYVCHLMNCPTLIKLFDTMKMTTEVLQKTKASFRSKELGELREKLESMLIEMNPVGAHSSD